MLGREQKETEDLVPVCSFEANRQFSDGWGFGEGRSSSMDTFLWRKSLQTFSILMNV